MQLVIIIIIMIKKKTSLDYLSWKLAFKLLSNIETDRRTNLVLTMENVTWYM